MRKQAHKNFVVGLVGLTIVFGTAIFIVYKFYLTASRSDGDTNYQANEISVFEKKTYGQQLLDDKSEANATVNLNEIKQLWAASVRPSESEVAYNSHLGAAELLPVLVSLREQGEPSASYYLSRVIDHCRSLKAMTSKLKEKAEKSGMEYYSYLNEKSPVRRQQLDIRDAYCSAIPAGVELSRSAVEKFLTEAAKNLVLEAKIRMDGISEDPDDSIGWFFTSQKRKDLFLEILQDSKFARTPASLLEMAVQLTEKGAGDTNGIIAELVVAACSSHLNCETSTREELMWLCNLYSCEAGDDYLALAQRLSGSKDRDALVRSAKDLTIGVLTKDNYLKQQLMDKFVDFAESHGI